MTLAAFLFFGARFTPPAYSLTPNGTVIVAQTEASFFQLEIGTWSQATSNTVLMVVARIAGVSLSDAGPQMAAAGQAVTFSHTLTNTGNGEDTFSLSVAVGGELTLTGVSVYHDVNWNGVIDPGESSLAAVASLPMGGTLALLVQAMIPPSAAAGQSGTLTITATSASSGETSASRLDQVTVTTDALVTLGLGVEPVGEVQAGAQMTATISWINRGVLDAAGVATPVRIGSQNGRGGTLTTLTGVQLLAVIPTNTVFSWTTPTAVPTGGITLYQIGGVLFDSFDPENPQAVAKIGELLPGPLGAGRTGSFTFVVTVLPETTETVIRLVATVTYHDHDPATGPITVSSNETQNRVTGSKETARFVDEAGRDRTYYRAGERIFLRARVSALNRDGLVADSLTLTVTCSATGDEEVVTLTESAPNSGLFIGSILLNELPSNGIPSTLTAQPHNSVLEVVSNSTVRLTFTDPVNGQTLFDEALIDPSGAVFDSVTGASLEGVTVALIDDATGLPVSLPLAGTPRTPQLNPVITGPDGRYAFPEVPVGSYRLSLSTLPNGAVFPSKLSPVSLPPGFTIDPTASYGGTFAHTSMDPPIHVDIPVDASHPLLLLKKTVDKSLAQIGDFVTYTLEIENASTTLSVLDIAIPDQLPAGITYVPGSATCTPPGGTPAVPLADPPQMRAAIFSLACTAPVVGRLAIGETAIITYKAVVSPGAIFGDGVNRAVATGSSGDPRLPVRSNEAAAKVKVIPGVFTDRGIVIGKVFLDLNGNGIQDPPTLNRPRQGGEDAEGEPGIPGVWLILEDGTFTITDEEGKYSIYGVRPGTHVLKVDPTSLPPGWRLADISTRFAGDPRSRFIDLRPGELHKANFAIAPLPRDIYEPILRERREKAKLADELSGAVTAPYGVDGQPMAPLSATAVRPAAGIKTPVLNRMGSAPSPQRPPPPLPGTQIDLKALLAETTPELAIVAPADGQILPIDSTRLIVKGPADLDYKVTVNGAAIADDRAGTVLVNNERRIAAIEYVALHLVPGKNVLIVEGRDPFGNLRGQARITLIAPGTVKGLHLTADPEELPADGESKSRVTIELVDAGGVPVATRRIITVATSAGRIEAKDLDATTPGTQISIEGGQATVELISSTRVENAIVRVNLGELAEDLTIGFLPHLRDLVAVGIVEGSLNLKNLSGGLQPVLAGDQFQDGIFTEQRAALYLKGKVAGSYLLTLAYDSDKEAKERLFRDIQPDEFYPVYGDSSIKGFDAQSSQRLYVKIEKGRSYLLFGDYTTDVDGHELLAYQRSLTGAKYHYEDQAAAVTAFADQGTQRQVVNEIRGNGTSGFYPLTRSPVVENSERIEIITRDRERPELVLRVEPKARFVDYQLETRTGRLLFKSPVPSQDQELNPIFIKVTFEVEGGGEPFFTYGVDAKVKFLDRYQVGATFIDSEEPGNKLTLYGADLRMRVLPGLVFGVEIARSSSQIEGEGSGFKVALSGQPTDRCELTGSYLETDPNFVNPSSNIRPGKIEYGLRTSYRLSQTLRASFEAAISRDRITNARRRTIDLTVEKGLGPVKLEAGLRDLEDRGGSASSDVQTARAKVTGSLPGLPKLVLSGEVEQAINLSSAHAISLGSEYRLTSAIRLYAKQEWLSGLSGRNGIGGPGRRSLTVFGADTKTWPGTLLFSEYRISDAIAGREDQAAIGLRNQVTLAKGITLSSTFERTETISAPAGAAKNDSTAVALATEWLTRPDLKADIRYEIRLAQQETAQLGSVALAFKLNADVSLLGRELIAYTDRKESQVDPLSSTLVLGAAWRPVNHDWFNALARYELKVDKDGAASASTSSKQTAHVASIEANMAVAPRATLFVKYAGRLLDDRAMGLSRSSLTQMAQGRLTFDVTPRIDLGVDGRFLWQDQSRSLTQSWGVEAGYRLATNFWLSLGYNFTAYDQGAFAPDDELASQGPYLSFRYKFDEGLGRFLRGGPLTLKGEKPTQAVTEPIPDTEKIPVHCCPN